MHRKEAPLTLHQGTAASLCLLFILLNVPVGHVVKTFIHLKTKHKITKHKSNTLILGIYIAQLIGEAPSALKTLITDFTVRQRWFITASLQQTCSTSQGQALN